MTDMLSERGIRLGAGGGTIVAGALGAAVETHQPRPWGIGAERSKPFLGNVTET